MSVGLGPRSRAASLVLIGSLLVALQLVLRGDADIRTQVAGQMVAFALFVPAAFLCWRGLGVGRAGVVVVLVFAVAFRVAAFDPGGAPPLSTDVYRYAWDARVQAEGINPYRYAPTDTALASLVDPEIWPRINLPTWKTVYPPAAEEGFLLARVVFGDGARATTWLFLLAEAAAAGLLVLVLARRSAPLERVGLYAWQPLAVSEIAANGHVDALTVLAGAGLLAAWQARRFALAGDRGRVRGDGAARAVAARARARTARGVALRRGRRGAVRRKRGAVPLRRHGRGRQPRRLRRAPALRRQPLVAARNAFQRQPPADHRAARRRPPRGRRVGVASPARRPGAGGPDLPPRARRPARRARLRPAVARSLAPAVLRRHDRARLDVARGDAPASLPVRPRPGSPRLGARRRLRAPRALGALAVGAGAEAPAGRRAHAASSTRPVSPR